MLTERAIRSLSFVLQAGCGIYVYPYKWDRAKFELRPPSRFHLFVYDCQRIFQHIVTIFTIFRFATVPNWDEVPDRQKIIHAVWVLAHCLNATCFIQFQLTGEQVKEFVNLMWIYILKYRGTETKTDFVSACTIFTGFIIAVNGPAHGVGLIEIPCTPNFWSSLFFPCVNPGDDVEPFLTKLPWLLLETYSVTVMLFQMGFNSIFVFLGVSWVRHQLRRAHTGQRHGHDNRVKDVPTLMNVMTHYRTCQRTNNLLKESFNTYLTWNPMWLMGLISILLFAIIKLWEIPLHAYLIFIACYFRCLSEAIAPLAMAGYMQEDSLEVLDEFDKTPYLGLDMTPFTTKWVKAFRRSCPVIRCTAGSLYAFENSIVISTIHNSLQLTMNLLLMSKDS